MSTRDPELASESLPGSDYGAVVAMASFVERDAESRMRLGHCCLTINEPKMTWQVYFSGGPKELLL